MGVASSFQELGSVDAAVAQITGADVYYVAVLLNGPLGLSVIDGTADLHSAFQDAGSRALLNEYPDASTFNSLNSPIRAHRTLADGTQRFVLEELVTGSCHACDPIGYALTFLEVGPATGGKLVRRPVGLGYAILPGADMEIVDFSAELLQQTPTALQFLLNELGYDAGSMDGAFGEMGRAALIDFQRDHCLLISGQIDKATFDAILSDNGFDPARCASKTASLTASDIPSQDVTTKPLVAAGTVSPSFDCEKATTPDELSICSNADLAELDQLSATGYRYVTEKFGSEYARKIGKNILKDRHACGEDVSCIRRVQLAAITTYVAEGAPIKTGTPAMTKAQPLPAAFSCTEDDVLSEPGGCHICLTKAPADRVTWSGQCVDGNADGAGVIDWYQGSSLIWRLTSSRYEVVSAGHVTDHYEASGAFTLDYLSTDGGIVTGCIPEVSGGSFTLPQVRINIDADYPMQINDAAGTLMMAVETQVAQDCAKAIKAADINFSDVKNAHITVFGASPAYPDLRPTCEYGHNQINQIHGCYSNGNPWARAFTQALYNETQQLASQKRKEEEAKQAAVAAQAAEAQKISADPCRTAAWSGVIENLADNFFCDKSRAMSLTAAGVELRFYVQDVQFNNGSITLKMGRRTSFIEALAAKVNSGEINDFNTSLQVASAAARWFYCSFPPGSDPGLSIGQSGVLHAKLNTFSADNVILACSK